MKKINSIGIAAILLAATLASCANVATQKALSGNIKVTSSDAVGAAQWLDARLETYPTKVVVGTDASAYGIDVSTLENDGYIIRTVGDETLIFARGETGLDAAVRKYAKEAEISGKAPSDAVFHEGARIEKLTIAGNDLSSYSIVITEGKGDHAAYFQNWVKANAASSLSKLLEIATGVTVPFADASSEGPRFIFDKVEETEAFAQSDFIYEVAENGNVTFTYSDMVGAKYAMLMFLQNELGWQDISYGDDVLPDADEIAIPAGTRNETHAMFDFGVYPYNNYNQPVVGFKNTLRDRVNGGLYSTWYKVQNAGHGITRWTNSANFKQICYTDEAEYNGIFDKIYTYIVDQLEAGAVIGESLNKIDVAQSDYFGYCTCKNCLKIKSEENDSNAGPVVRWVNRLEEEMDAEGFDGLKYTFFAYHGSNKPCITHCNEDVSVTFCTDGHCSRHFLDGSQCQWESFDELGTLGEGYLHLNNNHYAEFIKGWCEICPDTYVWFYALDNNVHQYTIIHQMYEDFKFLSECGVKGIFWQIPYCGMGLGKIEQELGMLMYLNPEMTKEEYWDEVDRLLENTYGDGWAEIREYIDLQEKCEITVADCWNCWGYSGNTDFNNSDPATYLENWDRMIELLETAITKATTARQQAACEVLSVSMYYIGCYYGYFPAYVANDSERLAVLAERYDLLVKRLTDNGFDISAIIGVDNLKMSIHGDINVMAWNEWIRDFDKLAPGADVNSVTFPEEWIFVPEEGPEV
jgi:hypothetical protein